MFLIDTSVWIDFFRNRDNASVRYFMDIVDKNLAFGITSTIYQEILQGAATKFDFNQLKIYLETQRFYHPSDELQSYQEAALLYFNCRRKGITIRSTIDCLIAQIAIEHDLILLHNDNDFYQIKKVIRSLKLA